MRGRPGRAAAESPILPRCSAPDVGDVRRYFACAEMARASGMFRFRRRFVRRLRDCDIHGAPKHGVRKTKSAFPKEGAFCSG